MKRFVGAVLFVAVCFGPTWAQTEKKSEKGPSTSEAVKQLEHDWSDGAKAGDADKVGAVMADDWKGIGPDGKVETKQQYTDDVKSGKLKLESFDFGPMEVKVVGSTAIVQGSDTEKSSYDGKDTSGKSVWMDVFAKRDGKWQAVRSQTAMVK